MQLIIANQIHLIQKTTADIFMNFDSTSLISSSSVRGLLQLLHVASRVRYTDYKTQKHSYVYIVKYHFDLRCLMP